MLDINLENLTDEELLEYEKLQEQLIILEARENFITFMTYCWPDDDFVLSAHHEYSAEYLEAVEAGELKRLMMFMPPRSTKSEMCSKYFVAWWFGRNPKARIIGVSHSESLACKFSIEIKDIIISENYQKVFPGVAIKKNRNSAGEWELESGGEYRAAGAGSKIAGFGANLIVADDLISEQTAWSDVERNKINEWFVPGLRSRLQPGGAIVMPNTRWHPDDTAGYLLKMAKENEMADQWSVISFPAILDAETAKELDLEEGGSYFPDYWSLPELLRTKATSLEYAWESLYMQNPINPGGEIVKKSYWQIWSPADHDRDPVLFDTFMTVDTSYGETKKADYQVAMMWGCFYDRANQGEISIICMDMLRLRCNYTDFREKFADFYFQWMPERVLVEDKATGPILVQEMALQGIPIYSVNTKNKSKTERLQAAAPFIQQGLVYLYEGTWNELVMEECAAFPTGTNDDIVDNVSLAVNLVRREDMITLKDDGELTQQEPADEVNYRKMTKKVRRGYM